MKDAELRQELLLRHLDGSLRPEEEAEVADLLRSDPEARAFLREVAEHAVTVADLERAEQGRQTELAARKEWAGVGNETSGRTESPRTRLARWPFALAAAAIVALIASVFLPQASVESEIVWITEWGGAVQWTGDGGRVVRDLEVGSWLRGGTLESLSADSWGTLGFRDGSTVTVSGQSRLTISEHEQKELHLRAGSLSADVMPQPHGKPMLIHTPTAELEVLGTQLTVEAEPSSTTLSVNEGRVRLTRLADRSVAEVSAQHQVVASVDPHVELNVTPRPGAVTTWQSDVLTDAKYGKWLPAPGESDGSLRTAPMLLKYYAEKKHSPKKPITLYLALLSISRGDSAPVVLSSGGKLRVRGRIESAADVVFGITTRYPKGGFAGKYVVTRQAEVFQEPGEVFDMEFRPAEFQAKERKSADWPIGLELVDWWCFTKDKDAGLEITRVELLPPASLP